MNEKAKEKFTLPELSKLGTVAEMTQVRGGIGTRDTFTSDNVVLFRGRSSQDVDAADL